MRWYLLASRAMRMPYTTLRGAPAETEAYPVDIGFLRLEAIVQMPNPLAHLIEQAGRLQRRRAGFYGKFIPVLFCSAWCSKPAGKRVAALFLKRCIVAARMYPTYFAVYIALANNRGIT